MQLLELLVWGKSPKKRSAKLTMTGAQWKHMIHEMYKQLPAEHAKTAIDIVADHTKLH